MAIVNTVSQKTIRRLSGETDSPAKIITYCPHCAAQQVANGDEVPHFFVKNTDHWEACPVCNQEFEVCQDRG